MISNELKTLIDFCIGDGHVAKYHYGNSKRNGEGSYHYKLEHSDKQTEYLIHKVEVLSDLGFTGTFRENKKVLNSIEYTTISYCLHINDYVRQCYKWIVNNGRKAIDKHLLSVLDAKSLAYWFMDDGSANKENKSSSSPGNGYRYYYTYPVPKLSQFRLYTYGFTEKENNLIIDWAKEKFDINFLLVSGKRDGFYLKLSKLDERKKFIDLINPHIIPSMQYKISGILSYDGIEPIDVCRKRLNEEPPALQQDDATVQEG